MNPVQNGVQSPVVQLNVIPSLTSSAIYRYYCPDVQPVKRGPARRPADNINKGIFLGHNSALVSSHTDSGAGDYL